MQIFFRLFLGLVALVVVIVVGVITLNPNWRDWFLPASPPPLGPDAKIFYGSTKNFNEFSQYQDSQLILRHHPAGGGQSTLNVLTLMVDSQDLTFTGTAAQLNTYRTNKKTNFDNNFNRYWREVSYNHLSSTTQMPNRVYRLDGNFDDYYNRSFVDTTLTTSGLGAWPQRFAGNETAVFHVRDGNGRNLDVNLALQNREYTQNEFIQACQDAFNNARRNWVTCAAQGNQIRMTLARNEVKEGTFIRVKSGNNLNAIGLNGPLETPGVSDGSVRPSVRGLEISGNFPLQLANQVRVQIEVRAHADHFGTKILKPRTITITIPAGRYTKDQLHQRLLTGIGQPNWVESYNAGAKRIGLRLKEAVSKSLDSSIRVVGGMNLGDLGLNGPMRVDGVITLDYTDTVRGNRSRIVAEALSKHIARVAAQQNIAITQANEGRLKRLVQTEFEGFKSILVLFVEQNMSRVMPQRRAGASSVGWYNLRIPGAGNYVFKDQVRTGFMIGTGHEGWETWVHELGHVLSFVDIYSKSVHDSQFDRTYDYTNEWSMMDSHWDGAHIDAWHKTQFGKEWIPNNAIENVGTPGAGLNDTHKFTLTPLEFPFSDYANKGTNEYPAKQVIRIKLSDEHWIYVSNRQPGSNYSQKLPDDQEGQRPPAGAAGNPGGIFITDTLNPNSPFLYRSAVTTLNPHGTSRVGHTHGAPPGLPHSHRARGLKNGDTLDLKNSYPAYDGIKIKVVGTVAGDGTRPEALQIEIDRGPGDFVDLEIRPWKANSAYATEDIWIDWPGNGEENYPGANDPPLGNGDNTHWHPDGTVTNWIKVRVHNKGTKEATGVVVRAKVNQPMGMGARGVFVPLADSTPQNIPAGGFKDFKFDWRPTQKGHTCLRAEILTHTSTVAEIDLTNNWAQENINAFHPQSGSPYEPYDFIFNVNNDYEVPIDVVLTPTDLVSGMDLELEREQIRLKPDEDVDIKGRLHLDINKHPPGNDRKYRLGFNIHAMVATRDSYLPFGGISVDVYPGKKSELELNDIFRAKKTDRDVLVIPGRLKGDGSVAGQLVDGVLTDASGKNWMGQAVVANNGSFQLEFENVPPGPGKVMLYYFGKSMADTHLGPVNVAVPN